MLNALTLCGKEHFSGVLSTQRQWFFAKHRLPGGDDIQRNLSVRFRRYADIIQIHIPGSQQRIYACIGVGKAVFFRQCLGLIGAANTDCLQSGADSKLRENVL